MSWKFVDNIRRNDYDWIRFNEEQLYGNQIIIACGLLLWVVCERVQHAVVQRVINRAPIALIYTHILLYLSELNVLKVIIASNEALKWFSIPFIISPMWCKANQISIAIIGFPNGNWFGAVRFTEIQIIDWVSIVWSPLINSIIISFYQLMFVLTYSPWLLVWLILRAKHGSIRTLHVWFDLVWTSISGTLMTMLKLELNLLFSTIHEMENISSTIITANTKDFSFCYDILFWLSAITNG